MQRLPQLDIIRGFAILGIMLMNIFAFAYPIDFAHSLIRLDQANSLLDTCLYNLQTLFISGRFITLFNLLFGVSMLLILQSTDKSYLQRRLYWLCLFGVLHGILLWQGDILLWYALTGLIVLHRGYLQLDSAALWRKALRLFAVGLVMPLLYMLYLIFADAEPAVALTTEVLSAEKLLLTGPYVAQIEQRFVSTLMMLVMFVLSLFWLLAGIMLLGASLYKSGWFTTGFNMVTTKILFGLAVTLSAVTVLLDHLTAYDYELNVALPSQEIAVLVMALSFASVLIHFSKHHWLQHWLAPCGRMAFTLYISQTLLMVLLFRVIRPDWYGNLNRAELLAIASVAIFLQLVCARWYFKHFNQGPLEWCWRTLSKKPAIID